MSFEEHTDIFSAAYYSDWMTAALSAGVDLRDNNYYGYVSDEKRGRVEAVKIVKPAAVRREISRALFKCFADECAPGGIRPKVGGVTRSREHCPVTRVTIDEPEEAAFPEEDIMLDVDGADLDDDPDDLELIEEEYED